MKNVTLAIPEDLLKKSRAYATKNGTSLNELIRELLERVTADNKEHNIKMFFELKEKYGVNTEGYKWNRNDAYDRKVFL